MSAKSLLEGNVTCRPLAAGNRLALEIAEPSNRRPGNQIVRTVVHRAPEDPRCSRIEEMLQRGAANDERNLRRSVFEPAIAFFRALNMRPGNFQAIFLKNPRLDGKIAARVARESSLGSLEVAVYDVELNQTHSKSSLSISKMLNRLYITPRDHKQMRTG